MVLFFCMMQPAFLIPAHAEGPAGASGSAPASGSAGPAGAADSSQPAGGAGPAGAANSSNSANTPRTAGPESDVLLYMDGGAVQVSPGFTAGQETIGLSFEYGYRNIAKSGRILPVTVHLSNRTDAELKGELRIEVPGNVEDGSGGFLPADLSYVLPVQVAPGKNADFKHTISLGESSSELRIGLYDEEGKLLREARDTVTIQNVGAEMLIGILSDHPAQLGYFRGISVAGTALHTRTVELDPAGLPDSAAGLEQLDMIIISGLKSSRLSDRDLDTIRAWVEEGGVLLLGSGKDVEILHRLEDKLGELTIGEAELRDVDMGMKYSKTGPDGAVIMLMVRDLFSSEGMQVMQSGDTAMLTTFSRGSGVVGLTAYDLCEISDFCSEEIAYTDDLLQALLGSARIDRMANTGSGSRSIYMKAQELLGFVDPGRLPRMSFFILTVSLYLAMLGGLYFYLRSRQLGIYYHAFIPIMAFAGGLVIWALGMPLRNTGLRFEYAAVREVRDRTVSDTGFVRLETADTEEFTLALPASYELLPIVYGGNDNDDTPRFAGTKHTSVRISSGKAAAGEVEEISAKDWKPFSAGMLEFAMRGRQLEAGDTVQSDLHFFDRELTGKLRNNTGRDLENAVLLMYGHAVRLGDLPRDAEIDLENYEILNIPMGVPQLTAQKLTGYPYTGSDLRARVDVTRRAGLMEYYLQEAAGAYFSGARLLAFVKDKGIFEDLTADTGTDLQGSLLEVWFLSVGTENGARIWKSGLFADPKLISGEYDMTANATTGTAVLEYNLGSDITVQSLDFAKLSDVFEGEELTAFSGMMAIYNYGNGNYDLIQPGQLPLSGEQLKPYLSPGNTITVRYVQDEGNASGVSMFLPVPEVTGRKR